MTQMCLLDHDVLSAVCGAVKLELKRRELGQRNDWATDWPRRQQPAFRATTNERRD